MELGKLWIGEETLHCEASEQSPQLLSACPLQPSSSCWTPWPRSKIKKQKGKSGNNSFKLKVCSKSYFTLSAFLVYSSQVLRECENMAPARDHPVRLSTTRYTMSIFTCSLLLLALYGIPFFIPASFSPPCPSMLWNHVSTQNLWCWPSVQGDQHEPVKVVIALLLQLLQEHDHKHCSLGHLNTASSQGPWMVDLADCNRWNMRGQITCLKSSFQPSLFVVKKLPARWAAGWEEALLRQKWG